MKPFDPTAPMQQGITLLEASAGTGKTYSITSLVVTLVGIHGVPLGEILLVTFTRNATAELRERVRNRLVHAHGALTSGQSIEDPIYVVLAEHAERDPAVITRLRQAIERFDECVIRTIHGFCQRMLQQYAAVAGMDVDLELDPNADTLVDDLVDDWLSRERYEPDPRWNAFLSDHGIDKRKHLLGLARLAVGNPDLKLDTSPMPGGLAPLYAKRDAFRDVWAAGWKDDLLTALTQAHAAKRFKPRQKTYTPATFTKYADALTEWLESPEWPADPPDGVSKLLNVNNYVPGEPFEHESLPMLEDLTDHLNEYAAGQVARFLSWARDAFHTACEAMRIQPYSELVRSLADRVRPGAAQDIRQALVQAIGGNFQAALIDEFQDTDDAQWTLFREVFGQGNHWLYLIGDPKQAIYGFRGANVQVYLSARDAAGDRVFTMTRNYRSDAPLLRAMNHLMARPGFFGDSGIEYVSVDAPTREPVSRLNWPDPSPAVSPQPLQVHAVDWETAQQEPAKAMNKDLAMSMCAQVAAQDIVQLLQSQPRLHGERGSRPMVASDIAVLVRSGTQGDLVQQELRRVGVPSVQTGRRSVLTSEAARDLELWLTALVNSGRDSAARGAGITRMFGYTADLLIGLQAGEPDALATWDGWLTDLAEWREVLETGGFLRALRRALAKHDVHERVLQTVGGERYLTDLLHTAELTHVAQQSESLRSAGLLAWLSRARHDAQPEDAAEIRLERDDDAVTVMTIHKSKGLQFPVVVAPFLWATRSKQPGDATIAPQANDPTVRVLHLQPSPEDEEREAQAQWQEQMRLLYVALTRAENRVMIYPAKADSLADSPLGPLLYTQPSPSDDGDAASDDDSPPGLLSMIASATAHPDIHTQVAQPPAAVQWNPPPNDPNDLDVRRFTRRSLDRVWRRYSYTALTRDKGVVYAVPEEREGFDPDRASDGSGAGVRPSLNVPDDAPDVPLAGFPAGARAGIFLHEVFELVDFRAAGDAAVLGPVIDRLLVKHGFDSEWSEPLVHGLSQVLTTPLGGPMAQRALNTIAPNERFDELRFDFPLAGGDAWGRQSRKTVQSKDIVSAIQQRQATQAIRRIYLDGLLSVDLGRLAGFMTGSIDLIFRADDRWYVADYKSNRLDPGQTRRYPVHHFALEPMRFEMEQHHYYLQYHLYTLALHRYLRLRIPDYDYETHMGGVYYLFFRGMVGPHTPLHDNTVAGCFYDRPPEHVIHALDAAFDAGHGQVEAV